MVQALSGHIAFESIRKAVELSVNREIDVIVTAPLNKEALHLQGTIIPGILKSWQASLIQRTMPCCCMRKD